MPRGRPRQAPVQPDLTRDIEMTPQTPGAPTLNPMAGTEARPLRTTTVPTQGSAVARRGVVHVLCAGRKRRSGRVQANNGEHIDIIVPDPAENATAVEEYLDPVYQVGMTDEQRVAILAGHSADTIAIAGQHYHFVGGEVQDVLAAHVPWLEKHPLFAFQAVSD